MFDFNFELLQYNNSSPSVFLIVSYLSSYTTYFLTPSLSWNNCIVMLNIQSLKREPAVWFLAYFINFQKIWYIRFPRNDDFWEQELNIYRKVSQCNCSSPPSDWQAGNTDLWSPVSDINQIKVAMTSTAPGCNQTPPCSRRKNVIQLGDPGIIITRDGLAIFSAQQSAPLSIAQK